MRVGDVIAEIMKRERINVLFVYPLTPLTEYAAAADIRPIVVRQERVACAMADAGGRLSSSDDVKVYACQGGPGIENSSRSSPPNRATRSRIPIMPAPCGGPPA